MKAALLLRILFIGNSLTEANDLPAMVERLCALERRRCQVTMIARPNFSLADHLSSHTLDRALEQEWDVVVLQQGPSALPASRRDLMRDTRAIAELLPTRTRVALLMVWPAAEQASLWSHVDESYRLTANIAGGLLIPAGRALRSAMQQDPKLKLLGPDGFHPAVAGTYLAALATYRAITGGLPPSVADPKVARRIAGARLEVTGEQLRAMLAAVR